MPSLDSPTLNDQFGFRPYVRGIADLITGLDRDELPATVGVYGGWGSGKTSFMSQLDKLLEGEGGAPAVWFEAWKYDRTEDVRSALIFKILGDIESQSRDTVKKKAADVMTKGAELALAFASRVTVAGVNIKLPTVGELTKSSKSGLTAIDTFSQEFASAVDDYLKASRKDRLMVFVDDLDRCLPGNVILVLEALKLFLESARCVFVIGLDRRVVEAAVEAHYGTGIGSFGREYVDKLIRYPFELPTPRLQDLRTRYAAVESLSGLQADDWLIVQEATRNNPRSFLRILSEWRVMSALADKFFIRLDDDLQRQLLLFAVCAHVCYPRLYEACRSRPDHIQMFADICRKTPQAGALDYLERNGATEFKLLWDVPSVTSFVNACHKRFELIFQLQDEIKARAFSLMGSSS